MAENSSISDQVMPTVMACREILMEYFKNTCIERVTTRTNVKLRNPQRPNGYYFERHEAELKEERQVFIGNVPIMTVSKQPDTARFHTLTMNRSPQLREIKRQLEEFLSEYLMAVRKEEDDACIFTAQ